MSEDMSRSDASLVRIVGFRSFFVPIYEHFQHIPKDIILLESLQRKSKIG
jgi:hypothetical protein